MGNIEARAIRITDDCEFNDVDSFAEFMGYYLSEGSCSYHKDKKSWQVKIAQSKHLDVMNECCRRLFSKVWKATDAVYIPVTDSVGKYFKSLGRSHEKCVPKWIKESNKSIIDIFLKAYRLGDGSERTRTHFGGYESTEICYYTSSEAMMSDIGELILKLGASPSYSWNDHPDFIDKSGKMHHANRPVATISHNKGGSAHSKYLNIEEIDYDGLVYCLELKKNNTMFVRRNGRVTITGNCRCTLEIVPIGIS